MRSSVRLLLLSVSLPLAVLLAQTSSFAQEVGTSNNSRIVGTVQDADTGEPVPDVTLTLEPLGRTALTGASGQFQIRDLPAGEFTLRMEHVAYGEQSMPVDVGRGVTVELSIPLSPKAVEMEPLEVRVEQEIKLRHLENKGFYERAEGGTGFGHFMTPLDLEKRNPARVSHVLQQMPSVKIARDCSGSSEGTASPYCRSIPVMIGTAPTGTGGFSRSLTSGTTDNRGLAGCPATVYLDGHKVQLGGMGIDDLVPATSIAAVEVYRGAAATAPTFIDSDSRCGVVVLWTKRGPGN